MQTARYRFRQRLAELGFESYGAYLASDHWKRLRSRYRQSGRPQRCSVCRSHRFQLHHRTYERLGAEHLDDLIPLCRHCHAKTHDTKAPLNSAHENVKPVVLREEQYQQDRERARRKGLGMTKPKRGKRRARASDIGKTRKTRKLS